MDCINEVPHSMRYEPTSINLENKNSSHSLTIEMVGYSKQVLEVGTSTGYITNILKQRGNRVIGIEIDKEAGEAASKYCESMIIGDIEEINLDKYLEISSIDVILFGDVLEHLRWPERTIKRVKKYLTPGGYLVVSLPNICHGDVLLNLLSGNFKYTSMGLLDETHLRFFGRENIIDIFNKSGYNIKEFHTTIVPIGSTELKLDLNQVPQELIKFLKNLPDTEVYQFVFNAVPSERHDGELTSDVDLRKAFALGIEDLMPRYKDLDVALSEQFQQANNHAAARSQEISQLKKNLEDQNDRVTILTEELQKANNQTVACCQKIAEMQRSIIWRMTMTFHKSIVEKTLPKGSMRRRLYDTALERGRRMLS